MILLFHNDNSKTATTSSKTLPQQQHNSCNTVALPTNSTLDRQHCHKHNTVAKLWKQNNHMAIALPPQHHTSQSQCSRCHAPFAIKTIQPLTQHCCNFIAEKQMKDHFPAIEAPPAHHKRCNVAITMPSSTPLQHCCCNDMDTSLPPLPSTVTISLKHHHYNVVILMLMYTTEPIKLQLV